MPDALPEPPFCVSVPLIVAGCGATGTAILTQLPKLFNHHALLSKLARASAISDDTADFVHQHAASEIADRLAVTNRSFSDIVEVFPRSTHMVAHMQRLYPQATHTQVSEQGENRDALALPPQQADLVVSVFGLHWCNDLPGVLAQIKNSLKPDGLFIAALPGEDCLRELRQALLQAETIVRGGAAARVDPFISVRQAGALLQRAGFALPVADVDTLDLRYRSFERLIADLRANGATSSLAGTTPPLNREIISRTRETLHRDFADDNGNIAATASIVFMSGWSPHASQQQPLKPGSAKHSLARQLGKLA